MGTGPPALQETIRVRDGDVIRSTCGLCPIGCGVVIHRRDGRIVDVKGDENHPLNKGVLCVKGLASLEYLYHKDRLTFPLKRVGARGAGEWQVITWDEALTLVARELENARRSYGAESVAFIHGAAKGLQDSYLARFANRFGSPNTVWQGHVCFVPRVMASKITYGYYAVPDYEYPPSCIVVWGKNPRETLHHAHTRIVKARDEGAKIVVIDPRRTDLAENADVWLQLQPGTDLALALGMLHVIIDEELCDKDFVSDWTVGFDTLREHVRRYTLDRVQDITWVSADLVRQAARLYARHQPASLQWGNAIDHGVNSFQTARALCILRAVTGNLGIPGGEVRAVLPQLAGRRSRELELFDINPPETVPQRVGSALKTLPLVRYVQPYAVVTAMVEHNPYRIAAAYVQGANPLLTYSNAQRTADALGRLDFLAVADMFMTPTAALADVVLPVASYLECDSIVTPPYSYPVLSVQRAVTRIHDCRSDYEILRGLAEKLGMEEDFWPTEEACLDAVRNPRASPSRS